MARKGPVIWHAYRRKENILSTKDSIEPIARGKHLALREDGNGVAETRRSEVMRKIVVKQDAEKPVPIEVTAESIKAISDGIKKLRAGKLNERALLLLIVQACPVPKGWPRRPVTTKQVKAVLEGMEQLEREYLKPAQVGKKS